MPSSHRVFSLKEFNYAVRPIFLPLCDAVNWCTGKHTNLNVDDWTLLCQWLPPNVITHCYQEFSMDLYSWLISRLLAPGQSLRMHRWELLSWSWHTIGYGKRKHKTSDRIKSASYSFKWPHIFSHMSETVNFYCFFCCGSVSMHASNYFVGTVH